MNTFSQGSRQKVQNACCYEPSIFFWSRPRSYINYVYDIYVVIFRYRTVLKYCLQDLAYRQKH